MASLLCASKALGVTARLHTLTVVCLLCTWWPQITADYATYSVHNMHEFQCHCGAARCRGLIKGTDYLEPWVDELYGDHVSEYVALKRAEAKAKAQALGTDS
jgi:hypothetical protein